LLQRIIRFYFFIEHRVRGFKFKDIPVGSGRSQFPVLPIIKVPKTKDQRKIAEIPFYLTHTITGKIHVISRTIFSGLKQKHPAAFTVNMPGYIHQFIRSDEIPSPVGADIHVAEIAFPLANVGDLNYAAHFYFSSGEIFTSFLPGQSE
jgi:hypothetical protein